MVEKSDTSWMISPQQFADEFHHVVSRRAGEIQDHWYGDVRGYTQLLLNGVDGVLNDVRKQFGLMHWGAEFLRLDAAYSTEPAEGETHRLALVVEHENAVRTARWEVRKLAYIACPLRVLITYPGSVSKDEDLLDEYCRLIEAIGVFARGELLVVFAGEDMPQFDPRATSIAWRYYRYAGSEFLPLYPRR